MPGFRLRQVVSGVPVAVWALTAAHLLVLACYSVLAPTYRAPDEYKHVDGVLALYHGQGWAEPGDRRVTEQVYGSTVYLGFVWHTPRQHAAGDAPYRPDRPTFDELGGTETAQVTEPLAPPSHSPESANLEEARRLDNAVTLHPPLYYLLLAGLLHLVPVVDAWAFDSVVGLLRLVNVVLVAPVPLLAYAAARRALDGIRGKRRGAAAVAAAAALFMVPQWAHLSSTVNNDNLLNLVAALLTVVLVGVAAGDRSMRSAAWVGSLLALALLTKGLALALPLWVAAAYGLGWWRTRGRPPWSPLALAAVVSLAGGWWWITNLVVHGSLQPTGGEPPVDTAEAVASFPTFLVDWYGRFLFERWWGSFGWIDTPLAPPVVLAATLLVGVGVALAVTVRWRGRRDTRWDAALLLVPTAVLLVLNVSATWSYYELTGIPAGIQGRYLYVGLVGLLLCGVLGYGRALGAARRWLPVVVLAVAAALQTAGVLRLLDRYWGTPDGGLLAAARAVVAWSPWTGRLVVPLFVVATAVALAAVGVVVRDVVRADGSAADEGGDPLAQPVGRHRQSRSR